MGKGWAKGLTAATDPRVARMAVAHRGVRYERRIPLEAGRWLRQHRTTLPLAWSDAMAYVVGLTATDGCLVTGRRAINFKSGDRDLVATYLALLGRTNRITTQPTTTGGVVFYTQFHDSALYEWLRFAGLTPRKSLTLGGFDVPDAHLFPLLRGLLDGDGSIINKVYRADTGRRTDYYWEYLVTTFNSASRVHLEWIAERIARATGLASKVQEVRRRIARPDRRPFFTLRYGKRASLILLPSLYPPGSPCLVRKRAIWHAYASRHGIVPR